jgi:hypothetical protein
MKTRACGWGAISDLIIEHSLMETVRYRHIEIQNSCCNDCGSCFSFRNTDEAK